MDENQSKIDLIWGLKDIANAIGRTASQTHYMLSTGKIPAKQIGNRWVIERSKLVAFFMGEPA